MKVFIRDEKKIFFIAGCRTGKTRPFFKISKHANVQLLKIWQKTQLWEILQLTKLIFINNIPHEN